MLDSKIEQSKVGLNHFGHKCVFRCIYMGLLEKGGIYEVIWSTSLYQFRAFVGEPRRVGDGAARRDCLPFAKGWRVTTTFNLTWPLATLSFEYNLDTIY